MRRTENSRVNGPETGDEEGETDADLEVEVEIEIQIEMNEAKIQRKNAKRNPAKKLVVDRRDEIGSVGDAVAEAEASEAVIQIDIQRSQQKL